MLGLIAGPAAPLAHAQTGSGGRSPLQRATEEAHANSALLLPGQSQPDDPMQVGCAAFDREDFAAAKVAFEQAVAEAPNNSDAWFALAQTCLRVQDRKRGLEAIERVASLRPELAEHSALVNLRTDLLNLPEAPAAAPSPARDAALVLAIAITRQLIAEARGKTSETEMLATMGQARERLVRAMVDPTKEDAEAWQMLGSIAVVLKDANDAALAFEAIGRLRPEWPNDAALLNLMASLDLLGAGKALEETRDARRNFEQGYKGRESTPFAQFSLGAMYDNGRGVAKNEAEAVKWYRKAAEQRDADAY